MKRTNKIVLGSIALGVSGIALGAAAGVGTILAGRKLLRRLSSLQGQDLSGQTVLITGSSRGLGLALAEEFARHGCRIAICARDPEELSRARAQIEHVGAEVVAVTCDVSRQEEVEHMIDVVRRRFGRIDILVNNAGIISVGPLLTHKLEDFQEAMNVIFWGTVHPTLAVLPSMLQEGRGKIANITSLGGKVSVPHLLPYSCAKFAAVGFSEGLHAELKKFGIHVSTVVPGPMRTGSHVNAVFKGQQKYEYGWFALSGANPLFSISVERAARQIVDGIRNNRPELTLGLRAKLLTTVHGIAPGLISEAMALVNRLLPAAEGGSMVKKSGREVEWAVTRSPLTALSTRAARRYNQLRQTS
jgi:short-subunit dehydrogenase